MYLHTYIPTQSGVLLKGFTHKYRYIFHVNKTSKKEEKLHTYLSGTSLASALTHRMRGEGVELQGRVLSSSDGPRLINNDIDGPWNPELSYLLP